MSSYSRSILLRIDPSFSGCTSGQRRRGKPRRREHEPRRRESEPRRTGSEPRPLVRGRRRRTG